MVFKLLLEADEDTRSDFPLLYDLNICQPRKIIRGRPYYYGVCKRVDGKPKIVSHALADRGGIRRRPHPRPLAIRRGCEKVFGSIMRRLLPLRSNQLTSQRFWDPMHRVPVPALPAIERDIVAAMTREFRLDLGQVLATNSLPTSIPSTSAPNWLSAVTARRAAGRSGVALLVTAEPH